MIYYSCQAVANGRKGGKPIIRYRCVPSSKSLGGSMLTHSVSNSATSETVAARLSHEASTTGSSHSVIRFSMSLGMSIPRERRTSNSALTSPIWIPSARPSSLSFLPPQLPLCSASSDKLCAHFPNSRGSVGGGGRSEAPAHSASEVPANPCASRPLHEGRDLFQTRTTHSVCEHENALCSSASSFAVMR